MKYVEDNAVDLGINSREDEMLQKLFHLKSYERPDPARMLRNQQNIIRKVRESQSQKRWGVADLLEMNIPWFFAQPRYGIAALFIVFASLQFWGINSQTASRDETGIYMRESALALSAPRAESYTNSIRYPDIPAGLNLFPNQSSSDEGVMFVGRRETLK